MSERWSVGAVVALAPDAPSDKAARALWNGTGWSQEGCHGHGVWGSCAGSGRTAYRVLVDTSGPAYKCSCPSRKIPCKHVLALLLRWADGTVTAVDVPPSDAEQWLAARAQRAEQGATRTGRAPAPPSASTLAKRAERVAGGVAELRRWLEDLIGTGLATVRGQGSAPFDRMAARLVDAQAPGLAGWVRELPSVMAGGSDWASRLTEELALLHLLARAHDRLDRLQAEDPELAASVRGYVGYPTARQSVLDEGTKVADLWGVHAIVDEQQDLVLRRTVHLSGETTGRQAVVLSFGPTQEALDASLPWGTTIDADLAFYPAAVPGRALVAELRGVRRQQSRPRTVSPEQVAQDRSAALTRDPWLPHTRHWVRGVLTRHENTWLLANPDTGHALPLLARHQLWPAIAAGGGTAVPHLVQWSRDGARLLSSLAAEGLVTS